jgi:crotonobetainyl-CoA:carnitine CoA-transferase CaiB-like acyl-CoA transferase
MKQKDYGPNGKGTLDGVRVLDLSRVVAGNMTSLQLADQGADVIKIEPLPAGDPLRAFKDGGYSTYWKVYCRNKRSLGLNFRAKGAPDLIRDLAAKTDVLMEGFRPGTLEEMGLAPDTLHTLNPGLVILRISGYGQTGPYSQRPGFGTIVEAMSGFAAQNGFADREPVLPPMALADMLAGLYGAFAVVAALRARERREAPGQVIDLSLLESMISTFGPEAAAHQVTGQVKPPLGSASLISVPRNVYQTNDGKWIGISGSAQSVTERIFRMIGREDMIDDPRYRDNQSRVQNREEVDAAVGGWMSTQTRRQALDACERGHVAAGPVYDIADLVKDDHVVERGVFEELPDDELGRVKMHAPIPRFSATPSGYRRPAPSLGQHSIEVLEEFGFDEARIRALRDEGIIAT